MKLSIYINNREYKIGCNILFQRAYSTKCNKRFVQSTNHAPMLREMKSTGYGYLVGTRIAIMDEYRIAGFNCADESGPAYATGKKEEVLLVTESLNKKPFYVRKQDVCV